MTVSVSSTHRDCRRVADAIYGSYQHAEIITLEGPRPSQLWTLPCISEVHIAFKFGGKTFPVHPLDAVMEPQDLGGEPFKNSLGIDMCLGSVGIILRLRIVLFSDL